MAFYYEIVTPASSEPLSLADAKAFLRVETNADDDLITAMISAARSSAEKYTNRIFAPTEFRVSQTSGQCVRLLRSPITSAPVVSTWDGTVFAPVSGAIFYPSAFFPSVTLAASVAQPSGQPFAIQATFTAGYETLPSDLLHALKMHVNYLYENRGDVEAEGIVNKVDTEGGLQIPSASKFIYRQYRIIPTYG